MENTHPQADTPHFTVDLITKRETKYEEQEKGPPKKIVETAQNFKLTMEDVEYKTETKLRLAFELAAFGAFKNDSDRLLDENDRIRYRDAVLKSLLIMARWEWFKKDEKFEIAPERHDQFDAIAKACFDPAWTWPKFLTNLQNAATTSRDKGDLLYLRIFPPEPVVLTEEQIRQSNLDVADELQQSASAEVARNSAQEERVLRAILDPEYDDVSMPMPEDDPEESPC